ncbi:MAG: type VI secretion system tube protein Hcp [Planctomycetota bacterium]
MHRAAIRLLLAVLLAGALSAADGQFLQVQAIAGLPDLPLDESALSIQRRADGVLAHRPLVISRRGDVATPVLLQALHGQHGIGRVVVLVRRAQGSQPALSLLRVVLEDCRIRSYEVVSCGADGILEERWEIAYGRIAWQVLDEPALAVQGVRSWRRFGWDTVSGSPWQPLDAPSDAVQRVILLHVQPPSAQVVDLLLRTQDEEGGIRLPVDETGQAGANGLWPDLNHLLDFLVVPFSDG